MKSQALLEKFLNLLETPQQKQLFKILWERYQEDLKRPGKPPRSMRLAALASEAGKSPESTKAALSKARDLFEVLAYKPIEHEGRLFRCSIELYRYSLTIKSEPDPWFYHRQFWEPYCLCGARDELPVLVGVLARLFFHIEGKADPAGDPQDDVYIRSKLVNHQTSEVSKSRILGGILASYQHHEYRQYMSTHDVLAAFSLLNLFAHLRVPAKGIRTAPGLDTDRSCVILGTSEDYEDVHIPTGNSQRYQLGPLGIYSRNSDPNNLPEVALFEPFRDKWRDSISVIHVLLSRWTKGRNVYTTIYSNGAAAISAVCDTLCSEKGNIRRLVELVFTAKPAQAVGRLEIPFRVTLRKSTRGYSHDAISVWDPETETFTPLA